MNVVGSVGLNGFWFCNCATKSCMNSLEFIEARAFVALADEAEPDVAAVDDGEEAA
jgi:hypothetical protein